MATVLFIGGCAGSGKTTLAEALAGKVSRGKRMRPVDSIFRVAARMGLTREQAFQILPAEENAVIEDFVANCRGQAVVYGDVHFAVQVARDSAIAVGQSPLRDCPEPYVAAISPDLIVRLKADASHSIVLVLLEVSSPATALARTIARDGTQPARNHTEEETTAEIEAERRFYTELAPFADRIFEFNTDTVSTALATSVLVRALSI